MCSQESHWNKNVIIETRGKKKLMEGIFRTLQFFLLCVKKQSFETKLERLERLETKENMQTDHLACQYHFGNWNIITVSQKVIILSMKRR